MCESVKYQKCLSCLLPSPSSPNSLQEGCMPIWLSEWVLFTDAVQHQMCRDVLLSTKNYCNAVNLKSHYGGAEANRSIVKLINLLLSFISQNKVVSQLVRRDQAGDCNSRSKHFLQELLRAFSNIYYKIFLWFSANFLFSSPSPQQLNSCHETQI